MGNKQSISQDFNLKAINKSVYNKLSKSSVESEASGFNQQNMNVKLGMIDGCDVDISQKIKSKVRTDVKNMPKEIIEMKGEIANKMKQAAAAKLKSETGAGATAIGNKAEISTKMNQTIENIVEKSITTENMSKAISKQVNIQGQDIEIKFMRCRAGQKGLNLSQDISSEVAANAVTDSLSKALMSDKFINDIAQTQKSESTVKATGPIQDLGNAISGILGSMTAIYAICGLVCCLAVAAAAYVLLSPGGQNSMRSASSMM